jgi:hypothetical protein
VRLRLTVPLLSLHQDDDKPDFLSVPRQSYYVMLSQHTSTYLSGDATTVGAVAGLASFACMRPLAAMHADCVCVEHC